MHAPYAKIGRFGIGGLAVRHYEAPLKNAQSPTILHFAPLQPHIEISSVRFLCELKHTVQLTYDQNLML